MASLLPGRLFPGPGVLVGLNVPIGNFASIFFALQRDQGGLAGRSCEASGRGISPEKKASTRP